MSVASLIVYNNLPFVVNDLAFSDVNNVESIKIPSLNQSTSDPGLEEIRKIDGFGLKTLIVKELLCVSFVGIIYGIKKLQEDIIDFFKYREVNIDTFNEMLIECDPEQYSDCSFLFILGRPDISLLSTTVVHFGKWIFGTCEGNPNFSISSAGSGSPIWNDEYIRSENFGFNGPEFLDKYIHKVLSNCMRLLSYERRNLVHLKDGWGGGFEIVYYFNGKFHKLDNVAYTFWKLNVDESDKVNLIAVIHNSYVSGQLIIRNIDSFDAKAYVLRQITDLSTSSIKCPILFDTEYLVSVIHVFQSGKEPEDLIVSHYADSSSSFLHTSLDKGRVAFKFSDQIIKALKNASDEFLN